MTSTIQCPTPVAILMAAYNAEKYIEEQIDSIIAQTSSDWTLYIRNDGSKDGTQSIIDSYVSRYPEKIIQIDKGGENLGCNKNFYRLLETVEADYYMFCDADDVWVKNRVELMRNAISEHEHEDSNCGILVQADSYVCDENLNVINNSLWRLNKLSYRDLTNFNSICISCTIGGASSIFNQTAKKIIIPIPGNTRIMYDHWIGMAISKNGKIFTLPIPLNFYRQHTGQVCGIAKRTSFIESIKQLPKKLENLKKEALMLKDVGYGGKRKFYINKTLNLIIKKLR